MWEVELEQPSYDQKLALRRTASSVRRTPEQTYRVDLGPE